MNLTEPLPLSGDVPAWPGVEVWVTQTGFQAAHQNSRPYGFNLGTHVGDDPLQVANRRQRLEVAVGVPIQWLNQVHGCTVHHAHGAAEAPPADASIALNASLALAIMTADCLPVLFAAYSDNGRDALGVGAAHAGWRGLHGGVLQATANELARACRVGTANVRAWLGPAIGPDSFEVGEEVKHAFETIGLICPASFKRGNQPGKYFANLYSLARLALKNVGVVDITGGGQDTLTDLNWFSHRRGQQAGVPAGRFASLIRLLPSPVV